MKLTTELYSLMRSIFIGESIEGMSCNTDNKKGYVNDRSRQALQSNWSIRGLTLGASGSCVQVAQSCISFLYLTCCPMTSLPSGRWFDDVRGHRWYYAN